MSFQLHPLYYRTQTDSLQCPQVALVPALEAVTNEPVNDIVLTSNIMTSFSPNVWQTFTMFEMLSPTTDLRMLLTWKTLPVGATVRIQVIKKDGDVVVYNNTNNPAINAFAGDFAKGTSILVKVICENLAINPDTRIAQLKFLRKTGTTFYYDVPPKDFTGQPSAEILQLFPQSALPDPTTKKVTMSLAGLTLQQGQTYLLAYVNFVATTSGFKYIKFPYGISMFNNVTELRTTFSATNQILFTIQALETATIPNNYTVECSVQDEDGIAPPTIQAVPLME